MPFHYGYWDGPGRARAAKAATTLLVTLGAINPEWCVVAVIAAAVVLVAVLGTWPGGCSAPGRKASRRVPPGQSIGLPPVTGMMAPVM